MRICMIRKSKKQVRRTYTPPPPLYRRNSDLSRVRALFTGLFKFHSPQQSRTSGRPILPILALTAVLCLPHCSSDDNGGGGSGGGDPEPVTTPIYLWRTNCTTQGDMMGGTCMNTTTGRMGADTICKDSFDDVVDETHRTRISEERGGAEQHKALLADSNPPLPQKFDIPNKDGAREIHLLNGTDQSKISDTYSEFFDPVENIDGGITGGTVIVHWTGLNFTAGDNYYELGNHCGNWRDRSMNGHVGQRIEEYSQRLDSSDTNCSGPYNLLCLSY